MKSRTYAAAGGKGLCNLFTFINISMVSKATNLEQNVETTLQCNISPC
jgi:hypothetical protein